MSEGIGAGCRSSSSRRGCARRWWDEIAREKVELSRLAAEGRLGARLAEGHGSGGQWGGQAALRSEEHAKGGGHEVGQIWRGWGREGKEIAKNGDCDIRWRCAFGGGGVGRG